MAPEQDDRDPTAEARAELPRVEDPESDVDPVAGFAQVQRVASVHTVLTPVHHDPPVPAKAQKGNVTLTLVPTTPRPTRSAMATMSDLGKAGTRGGYPQHVAKNRKPDPQ